VTADQVRQARDAGLAAGRALTPPAPNPYAPRHVPVWAGPRTPATKAAADAGAALARVLAAVWMDAYRRGLAAYAADRGLSLPSAQ
jgi:hypothetical protein